MQKTISKLFIGMILAALTALALAACWTALAPAAPPEPSSVIAENFC